MEIFRFNILPDEEFTQREMFKMSVLNCQVCGTDLKFKHHFEEKLNRVQEEGHCAICCVQMKPTQHPVH